MIQNCDTLFSYDKAGHLKSDSTGEGKISYSYDDVYDLVPLSRTLS